MHHSFPAIDQYSRPDAQDMPYIFPSSPAPSNCSSGPPQTQLDPYDPTFLSFYQNSFKELEDLLASPCANVSTPPEGATWNDLSQLYSTNPRLPGRSAKQAPPGQQFAFGDTPVHFPFDMGNFCLSPATNKKYSPVPIAPISLRDPPAPPPSCFLPHHPSPTNQTPFPQNCQLDDGSNFLTWPIPAAPVLESDDPSRQEDTRVTAPHPKRQPTQRASGCSSKKRKAGKADNVDEIVRAVLYFSSTPQC
jgi:hypothetical protein